MRDGNFGKGKGTNMVEPVFELPMRDGNSFAPGPTW